MIIVIFPFFCKDAKKCCHQVKDRLDDIEELVASVIDQSAVCCSTTEALLASIIDQNAQMIASSSVTDLVINQIFGCTCL
jgi:hypothetical protein